MTITKRHAKLARQYAAENSVSYMQALREVDNRQAATQEAPRLIFDLFSPQLRAPRFNPPFDLRTVAPKARITGYRELGALGIFTLHETADVAARAFDFENGWCKDVNSPRNSSVEEKLLEWGMAFSSYLADEAIDVPHSVEEAVDAWLDDDYDVDDDMGAGEALNLTPLLLSIPAYSDVPDTFGLDMETTLADTGMTVDFFSNKVRGLSPLHDVDTEPLVGRVRASAEPGGVSIAVDLNLDWSDEERIAAVTIMRADGPHVLARHALMMHTWGRAMAILTGVDMALDDVISPVKLDFRPID